MSFPLAAFTTLTLRLAALAESGGLQMAGTLLLALTSLVVFGLCLGTVRGLRSLQVGARKGPILPLIGGMPDAGHALLERHVCIDTTASGGNAQLLAEVSAA